MSGFFRWRTFAYIAAGVVVGAVVVGIIIASGGAATPLVVGGALALGGSLGAGGAVVHNSCDNHRDQGFTNLGAQLRQLQGASDASSTVVTDAASESTDQREAFAEAQAQLETAVATAASGAIREAVAQQKLATTQDVFEDGERTRSVVETNTDHVAGRINTAASHAPYSMFTVRRQRPDDGDQDPHPGAGAGQALT